MGSTTDTLTVTDMLTLRGTVGSRITPLDRTEVLQSDNFVFPIPFTDFRVHDALQTTLPGTSATDDLGLYGGTYGTSQPLLRTYDVKTVGATSLYARALVALPESYVAGQTVVLRVGCGMVTTIADVSCTIDVQAFRIGKDNTLGGDLVTTAATTMNSVTFSSKSFTINPATLGPGDVLDVRLTIAVNDAATATAVIAAIAGIDLLCDIQG